MSLRAKLALALGALAAATAIAVAVTGYRATADRIRSELDASLVSSAARFSDPDGNLVRAVCHSAGGEAPGGSDDRGKVSPPPYVEVPGTVQCLDSTGKAIAATADTEFPVGTDERAVASGHRSDYVLRTVSGDDHVRYRVLTVPVTGGGAIQIGRATASDERVLTSLRNRYLLLVAFVAVVASALGWWIARRTTRPVVALTAVAERIAASGDLDIEVDTHGRDEAGRLARSFATMLDALRGSREQQQRLVQDAGHELRTPLTSLRANVDTLRRHPEVAGERRDHMLADLDLELRELTTLTDELVQLAGEATDAEAEQQVDLADLALRSATRVHRRTGREVVTDLAPSPLMGRPRQLRRAIDNLLDNAQKFSPPGTPIELTVRPGSVTVRDHGAGVAEPDRAHVFDRFYRATAARSAPGSGLGLAIVRDVARRHGGTAAVANHPEGGAVFTLALPEGTWLVDASEQD